MKKLLAILLLVPGYAMAVCNPFIANTVLTASALNSAIANPCITGGTVVGVSIDNSPIGQSSPATIYITNANIAAAGTTQGTAAPLTAQSNKVISASGAANGVILPTPLRSGFFIEVDNDTAVTIYIYPAAGAQIDVNGTNVPDAIPAGGSVMYTSSSTSQWDSYLSQNQNFATINAASGVNATGAYTAPYTDGTVVDYTTGNGRISVGVNDCLTLYASGVANTQMSKFCTTGTQLQGTTTNDNAAAGQVGELVTSTVAISTINLTSGAAANITSISLTAGDWDVWGSVTFQPAATTTVTEISGAVSTTTVSTGTPGVNSSFTYMGGTTPTTSFVLTKESPIVRISIASTTTVYLVGEGWFAASTMTAGGTINARRVR